MRLPNKFKKFFNNANETIASNELKRKELVGRIKLPKYTPSSKSRITNQYPWNVIPKELYPYITNEEFMTLAREAGMTVMSEQPKNNAYEYYFYIDALTKDFTNKIMESESVKELIALGVEAPLEDIPESQHETNQG